MFLFGKVIGYRTKWFVVSCNALEVHQLFGGSVDSIFNIEE
jgi:hypothetical protein